MTIRVKQANLDKKDILTKIKERFSAQGKNYKKLIKANVYEGYEQRPDLEGPYKSAIGEIYYYDPKAGQYYNPKTDIYFEKDWDPSVGIKPQPLHWTEWGNKLDAIIKQKTGNAIDLEEAWTQPNTTVHDLHDWYQKGLSPDEAAIIFIQERL